MGYPKIADGSTFAVVAFMPHLVLSHPGRKAQLMVIGGCTGVYRITRPCYVEKNPVMNPLAKTWPCIDQRTDSTFDGNIAEDEM